MDIIFIRGLSAEAVIGVYDWEREIRQTLILDLEMASDTARAAAVDRIEEALDYHAVSERLRAFVGGSRFHLVETLAEQCAALIREEFGVPWLRLTIHKPGAVPEADVGVTIERGVR